MNQIHICDPRSFEYKKTFYNIIMIVHFHGNYTLSFLHNYVLSLSEYSHPYGSQYVEIITIVN